MTQSRNASVTGEIVTTVKQTAATRQSAMRLFLQRAYVVADTLHKSGDFSNQKGIIGDKLFEIVQRLGSSAHAARGVTLSLCAYKAVVPSQNILMYKDELEEGFSARTFDSLVTVPFLQSKSLRYNVETHWLSQSFSFPEDYTRGRVIRTTPRKMGPDMLETVNQVQESQNPQQLAGAIVEVLLALLIEERNKSKIILEKPKGVTIDQAIELIGRHFFDRKYQKNAPRLPQLAIYAIYQCIVPTMERYQDLELGRLERMKTANRKSGTVGDVDVNRQGQPFEAVEVKFDQPVSAAHVAEAVEKIKGVSVERYLILSTAGIYEADESSIRNVIADFKRANGCEIIVNGVLETIRYYLRLIRSTTDFVVAYTSLVEVDDDLGYEHREAWNAICADMFSLAGKVVVDGN